MGKRVAICALEQIRNQPSVWYQRFQGMLLDCLEPILEKTGVTFDMDKGIRSVITCSDDVFDARTISDSGMTDVVGAHFRGEEKMAQDAVNGLGYAMACILSGHDDVLLYMGHCKESQTESRNMNTNLAFDPFYMRPLGIDFVSANALQARAYMAKTGLDDDHLAGIVVRSRENGAKNPYARENEKVTVEQVKQSKFLADPIRELHYYPVTDWAFGMLLCSEERVREFTDQPVWITGYGSCMDSYFPGDRDLISNFALKEAARRAYRMAGVQDPRKEIDIFEFCDQSAYQLPMWAEGVGIVDEAKGAAWIDEGGPDQSHVNLSGGMLNGNPIMLGGAARVAEAWYQLRGQAGDRQVDKAERALAHGLTGAMGQHHGIVILEK